jgi:hypothetical protein
VRRAAIIPAIVAASVVSLAWAGGTQGVPRTGINQAKTPELLKTIPITKRGEPKTLVQVKADDLGPVHDGDSIEAFSEIEVSVTCLEPIPKCVGKIYRFSPKVEAQLVLADGKGRRGVPIGNPERITCSQDLPNRNHHCVLTLHRTETIRGTPPCAPACSLNLVLKAFHDKAVKGNVLVIGADRDDGIAQRRATLSAGIFSPGEAYDPRESKTTRRMVKKVDVNPNDTREVTVASIRLDRLTRGEVLAVEGRVTSSIGHLPYNVLSQGQIVISEKRGSSDNHGIPLSVATRNGLVTAKNGFNCTQGKSGFTTPCAIEKGAFVRILANSRKHPNHDEGKWMPLWVNFFVGFQEEYTTGRPWRRGDAAKIKSARLEIRRYTPQAP